MTAPTVATLTDAELADISALLYARSGMVFGHAKRYYIERRISDLMHGSDTTTVRGYISLVRADAREATRLVNRFTVNETYFYREQHQLACLSNSILPELIKSKGPGDRIRIWSLPCSTGEEPYSIAIWLLENWRLVDAYNVEIVGSDINTASLERAADGLYGTRSVARLSGDILDRYFEPPNKMQRRLISDIRESVIFRPTNLVDADSVATLGKFDVVFCRNLLIYFDDASRMTAINNLRQAIVPSGYICLGHTESMSRMSELFELVRYPDAIVYRRPNGGGNG